jgi:hypothetical protein
LDQWLRPWTNGASTAFSANFPQNSWFYDACTRTYHRLRLLKVAGRVKYLNWWPAEGWPRPFPEGEHGRMTRPFDEIVRLDRRWFRAHLETRCHCRSLDTGELASCENNRVALLVVAIRHIGRGRIVAARQTRSRPMARIRQ